MIISYPAIEIILYSIFNVSEANITKKDIKNKLNNELKKWELTYNHDLKTLDNITEYISKNQELIKSWIKNIEKLKQYKKSNFIEIINLLIKGKWYE